MIIPCIIKRAIPARIIMHTVMAIARVLPLHKQNDKCYHIFIGMISFVLKYYHLPGSISSNNSQMFNSSSFAWQKHRNTKYIYPRLRNICSKLRNNHEIIKYCGKIIKNLEKITKLKIDEKKTFQNT